MAEIFHPSGVRTSTINSAPTESTWRPRNSPRVELEDTAHATSPRTVTRIGRRSLCTARAKAMSDGRWCEMYSSRVSKPPPSRITASGASRDTAAALSPAARAAWSRPTAAATSAESVGDGPDEAGAGDRPWARRQAVERIRALTTPARRIADRRDAMECVTGHLDWKNGHFLLPMDNLFGTKRA